MQTAAKLNLNTNITTNSKQQQQNNKTSPSPPTPPPISHLPSFNRNNNNSKSDDNKSQNTNNFSNKITSKKNLIKATQEKIESFKNGFQQNSHNISALSSSSNQVCTSYSATVNNSNQNISNIATATTIQFPSSSSLSSNEFNSLQITNSDSCSISSFNSINKIPNDNNSQTSRSSSTENSPTKNASKSNSSSPSYKGRVSELKNCIAKINSRGLFSLSSSLSSSSSSSSTSTNSTIKNSSTSITINENADITIGNSVSNTTTTATAVPLKSCNNINEELSLTQNSNLNDYIICDPRNCTNALSQLPNNGSGSSSIVNSGNNYQNNETSPDDILTKPEFTSSMFKNIPVRQKKSVIQHMDNYCLFDPSVDFINEKSLSTSGISLSNPSGGNNTASGVIGSYCTYNSTISGCVNNSLIALNNEYKLPIDNHQRQSFYQNNSNNLFDNTCGNNSNSSSNNRNDIRLDSSVQCFPLHQNMPYNNDNDFVEEIIYDETADAYSAASDEAVYTNIIKTGHHSDNDSTYHNYFTIDVANLKSQSSSDLVRQHQEHEQSYVVEGQKQYTETNTKILDTNILKVQQNAQQQQQISLLISSTSSSTTSSVDDHNSSNQQQYPDTSSSSSSSTASSSLATTENSNVLNAINLNDCKLEKQQIHLLKQEKLKNLQENKLKEQHQQQQIILNTMILSKSLSSVNSIRYALTNNHNNNQQQQQRSSQRFILVPRSNTNEMNYRNRTIPIESNCILFNTGRIYNINNKRIQTIKTNTNTNCNGVVQHQYKIRKPRPLSTNSDADSGFLSPNSPDELKFNPALLMLEQCDSIQGYIEIYTDWANYYLERAKSKRKVTDLSADCRDGLLLADVIEAVTSFKVPDLIKKPKNQQQMYDNVNSCLSVLRQHSVGGLDNVTTNDICSGRLKAVLALFFALSRFKQQSKQQQRALTSLALTTTKHSDSNKSQQNLSQQQNQQSLQVQQQSSNQPQQSQQQQIQPPIAANLENGNPEAMITNRQIPVPYSKTNGGTAIPLPATVLVQRRCPPDKVRPLPPTPNHVPCTGKTVPNGGESINISASPNLPSNQKSSNSNGLRQPQCKIPSSPYAIPSQTTSPTIATTVTSNSLQNSLNSQQQQTVPPPLPASNSTTQSQTTTKHSMLEKLKLFKSDKSSTNSSSSTKSQVSKRTSSSSGFSSARSERSDSSLSLNDSNNHGALLQNQQQQLPPSTHLKPPNIVTTISAVSPQNATTSTSSRTKELNTKKQSKLLSSSSGGGSGNSGQKNKDLQSGGSSTKQKDNNKQKEKSPARHNSAKDDANDSKLISSSSGGSSSKGQKLTSKLSVTEQQKLKSSSKLSLNSTKSSDSKTSSVNPQQQNLKQQQQSGLVTVTNPNGTGIPKPMAAVKGTSKTVQITIEKSSHHQQQPHQLQQLHSKPNLDLDHVKSEKQDISLLRNTYNDPSISVATANHLDNTKTNVVTPLNIDIAAQQQQHHHHQNNLIIGSATTTAPGIPLTNGPILYNKILQQQQANNISMSDSLNSTSTTNSGGLHSNSSESSVIFRPGSESEASEYLTSNNCTTGNNSRSGTTNATAASGSNISLTTKQQMSFSNKKFDQFLQLQQQQNAIISRKSANQQLQFQNSMQHPQHQKFNTVPSKMGPNSIIGNCGIITTRDVISGNNTQIIGGTIYEEDKHSLSIIPMRPLLRGYNSHVTLPTRGTRSGQHFINDFYDSDIGGTGYMSDGDSLRRHHQQSNQSTASTTIRYSDIDNGYLSEGSIGIVHNQNHHNHQHHNQHHHHQHQSHSSKHFLNIMRGRQLPTTIEERVRGSRGSLESIITAPASINLSASLNLQQQQQLKSQQENNSNSNLNSNNNISLKNSSSGNSSNNTDNNSIIKMDINSTTVNNSGNYIGSNVSNNVITENSTCQQQQLHENSVSNRSSSRTTINSNQHNGRDNWHKMPEPNAPTNVMQQQILHQQGLTAVTSSPNPNRKDKSSPNRRGLSSSTSSKQSSSGRTKGVPQSFGYVKRTNGSATGTITTTDQQGMLLLQQQQQQHQQQQQQQQQQHHSSRTAHVSAVPRSGKIKVSGGTQTCQNDLQTKIPPNVQHRSFSLTGPGATQLSQSIRERLSNGSHSLPKPGSDMHMFQHRIANRNSNKILDGSLSDTQTYAEVKPEYSTYALWLKHSNTTASRLSEGDSMESLQHIMNSPAMQRHSAHKLMQRNITIGNNTGSGGSSVNSSNNIAGNTVNPNTISNNGGTTIESTYVQSPRMNRSNSISYLKERTYPRSTKSEKMYPSMLSRGSDVEIEPYYCLPVGSIHGQNGMPPGTGPGGSVVGIIPWSQPTSPTPPHARSAFNTSGTLSPTQTHSSTGLQSNSNGSNSISGHNNISSCHRLTYPKKNDEVHGSSASLLSGGSSLYGSAEERQANEVRRLKRELTEAREQVMSLSSQLSTNTVQ